MKVLVKSFVNFLIHSHQAVEVVLNSGFEITLVLVGILYSL